MKTEQELNEAATNDETRKHILNVAKFMNLVVIQLLIRAQEHDGSKLETPELELFTKVTDQLAGCTYGSPEYKAFLKELEPALEHHYAHLNNRHHPEHYKNGIEDMNIIDLLEMFIDWGAACKRHNNGNLRKSIEINAKRFNINPQLVKILENSVPILEKHP